MHKYDKVLHNVQEKLWETSSSEEVITQSFNYVGDVYFLGSVVLDSVFLIMLYTMITL